jgi:hypothetical protein
MAVNPFPPFPGTKDVSEGLGLLLDDWNADVAELYGCLKHVSDTLGKEMALRLNMFAQAKLPAEVLTVCRHKILCCCFVFNHVSFPSCGFCFAGECDIASCCAAAGSWQVADRGCISPTMAAVPNHHPAPVAPLMRSLYE